MLAAVCKPHIVTRLLTCIDYAVEGIDLQFDRLTDVRRKVKSDIRPVFPVVLAAVSAAGEGFPFGFGGDGTVAVADEGGGIGVEYIARSVGYLDIDMRLPVHFAVAFGVGNTVDKSGIFK